MNPSKQTVRPDNFKRMTLKKHLQSPFSLNLVHRLTRSRYRKIKIKEDEKKDKNCRKLVMLRLKR